MTEHRLIEEANSALRLIEVLRNHLNDEDRRAQRAEAECERLREKVREIAEGTQMDADRYRNDPNALRACVSLDGVAEDLHSLATPPPEGDPEQEAHPLRLDRVQACDFHGRDFGACAQHSGQIPCEPEGGDASHTPQAHVDTLAAWLVDAVSTASQHPALNESSPEYDQVLAEAIFNNGRAITASGVPYVPDQAKTTWEHIKGAMNAGHIPSENMMEDMDQALASAPADGYRMVPVEPTEAMIEAPFAKTRSEETRAEYGRERHRRIYRTMIAAAPTDGREHD